MLPPRLSPRAPAAGWTLLTAWQAGFARTSGTGTVTQLDTTQPGYQGAGALRITTPADGTETKVRNSSTFSPAWNVSGKQFRALIRCSNVAETTSFKLYLSSDSYTNFGFIDLVASGSTYRPVQSNEWVEVSFDWGDITFTGTPTRTAIINMQLAVTAKNGASVDCFFGGFWALNEPSLAIVSIGADDQWLSQYTTAAPILDTLALPWQANVIADLIENENPAYVSLAQMETLRDYHRVEHSCHALTVANHNKGFHTLTNSELVAELAGIKAWMQQHGFNAGMDHFALPLGAYLPAQLPIYKALFSSVRTLGAGNFSVCDTFPPNNWVRLHSAVINHTTSVATVEGWVTKAIANKEWLILVFHDVQAGSPSGSLQIGTTPFTEIMTNVATKQAEGSLVVRTLNEQLRQIPA